MTQPPLFWLKKIEGSLEELKQVPLWGSPPEFPWKECSDEIAAVLELADLKIEHRSTQLLKADQLLSGLGSVPMLVAVELAPLEGSAFWLMPSEDVSKFTQLALSPQNALKGFASLEFQEGFYHYLILNAIQSLDKLKAFGDLSIALGTQNQLPQEDSLCIDVRISHPKITTWGRLICPPAFHQLFKQHFGRKPQEPFLRLKDKQLPLSLSVEIGHTHLQMAEWNRLKVGDMVVLDRCTYDVKSHKGTAALKLKESALFRLRFKEDHLKIVEYAHYQEEYTSMDEDFSKEEEENIDDPAFSESDMHEEFAEDTEEHLWSTENAKETSVEDLVSAKDVPLTLSVEVARLQMNLEKLLELRPGNLIDLSVHPEQGVDLVLNGKKIAKGELVKLGEVIGVKILQIGS